MATTNTVPLGGNAFITGSPAAATEVITDYGLDNWTNGNTIISVFFRIAASASLKIEMNAYLIGSATSRVSVTVDGAQFDVDLAGTTAKTYQVCIVYVQGPSYVKVEMHGRSKSGSSFGSVSNLIVTTDTTVNCANDQANFYWSRRGPSLHMNYTMPANHEYFYNEVTVPVGQDVVGSYFMVAGFARGYCGMQVKETERWMIFSVWDAANGQQTTMLSQGGGVVVGRFSGEGTGGQAYLPFDFAAGSTYKFITRIRPEGNTGNTLYSAWFYPSPANQWRYLATWRRPATNTYQARVHSFLENFDAERGYKGRQATYSNQWALSTAGTAGKWTELTTGHFTGDATAANAQRMDYAGGLDAGGFYLRNGGFFVPNVGLDQDFDRPATGQPPAVDVSTLPTQ